MSVVHGAHKPYLNNSCKVPKAEAAEAAAYDPRPDLPDYLKVPLEQTPVGVEPAGRKDDGEKLDWTLLPWSSVKSIVAVLQGGAKRYGRENWKQVPDARRRYTAALHRHLYAVTDGEWLDPDDNLPHLAHAGCCILFLLWFGDDDADIVKKG